MLREIRALQIDLCMSDGQLMALAYDVAGTSVLRIVADLTDAEMATLLGELRWLAGLRQAA